MLTPEATSILTRPNRLRMGYEQFLKWTGEDVHAEWVNGEVIIHMPAKNFHQMTLGFLYELLGLFVQLFDLGRVMIAPFEVKILPGRASREPDLFFVAKENLHRLDEDRLTGPADLIVEIVSGDSVHRDRHQKFKEYQEAGVREYWIIDPRPGKLRADFYRLDETGQFDLFATEDEERVQSHVLPGFWLKTAWLWQVDRLNPIICGMENELVAAEFYRQAQLAHIAATQPNGGRP
ncbi:MAG: Uma2 family endonuclease [Chloroflexota bacterium]